MRPLQRCLVFSLLLVVLFPVLFSDYYLRDYSAFGRVFLLEVNAVFLDPETQWIIAVWFLIYGGTCLHLRLKYGIGRPAGDQSSLATSKSKRWLILAILHVMRTRFRASDSWLAMFVGFVGVGYFLNYAAACQSSKAITVLGTVAAGLAMRFWDMQHRSEDRAATMPAILLGCSILTLLTVAAVWHPHLSSFSYLGHTRWTGPWNSPNTFGVLMGVGLVFSCGLMFVVAAHLTVSREKKCLAMAVLLTSLSFLTLGLIHSYSRGAWLATAIAMVYMIGSCLSLSISRKLLARFRAPSSFLSHNLQLPSAIIVLCIGMLFVLNGREAAHPMVRRLASIVNRDDFSWRNRIAAWKGEMQMIAERPWVGHGWPHTELLYDEYYKPVEISESAAIQLNDYLNVAAAIGLPGMVAFTVFVGARIWESITRSTHEPSLIEVTFASVVVMLTVAFWFDGGLFKLSTASIFWISCCLANDRRKLGGETVET